MSYVPAAVDVVMFPPVSGLAEVLPYVGGGISEKFQNLIVELLLVLLPKLELDFVVSLLFGNNELLPLLAPPASLDLIVAAVAFAEVVVPFCWSAISI